MINATYDLISDLFVLMLMLGLFSRICATKPGAGIVIDDLKTSRRVRLYTRRNALRHYFTLFFLLSTLYSLQFTPTWIQSIQSPPGMSHLNLQHRIHHRRYLIQDSH